MLKQCLYYLRTDILGYLVLTTDSGTKADGSYLPKAQTCQGMIKLPLYVFDVLFSHAVVCSLCRGVQVRHSAAVARKVAEGDFRLVRQCVDTSLSYPRPALRHANSASYSPLPGLVFCSSDSIFARTPAMHSPALNIVLFYFKHTRTRTCARIHTAPAHKYPLRNSGGHRLRQSGGIGVLCLRQVKM